MVDATEQLLTKICAHVQRRTKTPLGAAQIGQKVGKAINATRWASAGTSTERSFSKRRSRTSWTPWSAAFCL
jgi:hypothetical protein